MGGASQVCYLISLMPSEASRLVTMKLGPEAGPCVCPLDATHPALCRAVITAGAARAAADTAENTCVLSAVPKLGVCEDCPKLKPTAP